MALAQVAVNEDMFTADVIADPYTYYGRLREDDPVHWNTLYELWVITRHADMVWMTRHHELFSNAVFRNDPARPIRPLRSRTWDCMSTSATTKPTSSFSTTALSSQRTGPGIPED